MEAFKQTKEGVLISVHVTPGAKESKVIGWKDNFLKVKVAAKPEKGEANRELVRLLSTYFNLPQSRIILVRGETTRHKTVLLEDKDINEMATLRFD